MVDAKSQDIDAIVALAPYTVQCVNALNKGDIKSAVDAYEGLKGSPLARHKAIGARVHLVAGRHVEAEGLLNEAIAIASKKSSKSHKYIEAYCRAFLCAPSDIEGFSYYTKIALSHDPDPNLFAALPIYDPKTHPHVAEGFSG